MSEEKKPAPTKVPDGHARFVTNHLIYGMDPQAAIDGPRCFPQAGELMVEAGYSDAQIDALAASGAARL